MLTRLLLHLRRDFARSTKNTQLREVIKIKKAQQSQTDSYKQEEGMLDEQGKIKAKINKQRKQEQKKLRQQISKLINQGIDQQHIIGKYTKGVKNKRKSSQQEQIHHFESMLKGKEGGASRLQQQQLSKLKQDMLINQIMKNSTKKQIPLTFTPSSKNDDQHQFDKQEKIMNTIYQNNQGSEIKQLTFEQKIRYNYPDTIVQMAQRQKNKQLSYFKQLTKQNYIVQHTKPEKLHPLDRRLKKGQTYTQMREKQIRQKALTKKQKKQRHQMLQDLEQLQEKQKAKNKIRSEELVAYEDETYYKDKGLKQFQIRSNLQKDIENKQYLEAGEKDMEQAGDIRSILLDEYDDTGSVQKYNKHLYQKSSFGKIDAKVADIQAKLKNHGIELDIQEIQGFKKQILFSEKKDRQQQLAYQKYLKKKQLKNKSKEYFKKVHSEELREDLDFQKQNRYEDFKYDPLDVEGNIEKIKQMNMEKKSVVLGRDQSEIIHFQKTERKMRSFINSYFYQDLFNPNQKLYHKIYITDMKFNKKKTVINIFWSFQDVSLSGNKASISQMTKKLQKSAPFMSGKMTQILGLRYGPDIRFLYEYILPQTQQIKQSLQQNKQEVIMYQLQNLIKKGHIKDEKQFMETKKKLEIIAQQNIDNYHNRKILMSKKFQKSLIQKSGQKSRNKNKNKKKAQQRFWQHIDKL